jgi:hypothetical protein
MTTHLSHHNFELLKSKIQFLSGLENVTPADCKIISCLILKKTKYNISETTIKRIYGFAESRFNPSQFTLEALCIYCNYNSWDDFCNQHIYNAGSASEEEVNWLALQRNASKTTKFTIEAIKTRSGIPYNKTIKRQFINDYIKALRESHNAGTVITAPAGYGKSIGLCHWVEEQVELNESKANNDIILFFSTTAMVNVIHSGRDINDWLLGLLGYTTDDDIKALWDDKQRKGSKFYLVIDGFDPYTFKPENYLILMRLITDLLALNQHTSWMKVILSMRNSTWLNYKHEFNVVDNMLLNGFITDEPGINVPLLSPADVKTLCGNLNQHLNRPSYAHIASDFNHPLFFQLYYKKYKENFTLTSINNGTMYELIYSYFLSKISIGSLAADKLLIIRKIASLTDIDRPSKGADKFELYNFIKKHNSGYQELLLNGLITEINNPGNVNDYQVTIKFNNQQFSTLSVALCLLNDHNNLFDSSLIAEINQRFGQSKYKLTILKWCILHAIKTGQQNNLLNLTACNFSPADKFELASYLGDAFSKESLLHNDDILLQHFKTDANDELFDYFFAPELLNKDYQNTLKNLLRFDIPDNKKILIYTALGIISAISLDIDELYIYMVKLKSFSTIDTMYFNINPSECIDTIYHYLKYGIIKKEALTTLTHLCFSPPAGSQELKNCAQNDMLYLLGMYTMSIGNNPKKTLRFINIIKNTYKSDDLSGQNTAYDFFVKTIMTDTYFRMGDHRMVTALYYTVLNSNQKQGSYLSSFMESLLYSVNVKYLLITDSPVAKEMEQLKASTEISGSKLTWLVALAAVLKKEESANTNTRFYIQAYNDYKKTAYQCGVNSGFYNIHYQLINKIEN